MRVIGSLDQTSVINYNPGLKPGGRRVDERKMTLSKPVWRAIAPAVAAAFLFFATRTDLYNATSPPGLSRDLFGAEVLQFAHPWWLSLHIWLRKAYSIVAFALVGFTIQRALPPASRPALRAAAILGMYSLGIEVAQRLVAATEPVMESVLDVACGAIGGWLAVLTDRYLHSHPPRSRLPRDAALSEIGTIHASTKPKRTGLASAIDRRAAHAKRPILRPTDRPWSCGLSEMPENAERTKPRKRDCIEDVD